MKRATIAAILLVAVVGGGLGAVGMEQADPVGEADAIVVPDWCGWVTLGMNECDTEADVGDQLNGTDAEETKINIYDSAAQSSQNVKLVLDSTDNSLQHIDQIALMEAKNAYIRALNNGSTEPVARSMAKDAADDFYAVHQIQLRNHWNATAATVAYQVGVAENTTGVIQGSDGSFVRAKTGSAPSDEETWIAGSLSTRSHTLVNGTEINSAGLQFDHSSYESAVVGVADGEVSLGNQYDYMTVSVMPPNDNYDLLHLTWLSNWSAAWSGFEDQNADVKAEIDTFVNGTYDAYQEGDINNSDLIDPYLCSRDYGPESDYQAWATCSLTAMGTNSPENLSSQGYFEVAHGGQVSEGMLLSDGLPQGDSFEVGTTYNAQNLAGVQAVVTAEEMVEIDGEFSILNATNADGETYDEGEEIVYRNVTYETTDTQEYQQLLQDLQNTSQQIEERQQNLRSGIGGGGGGGFFGLALGLFETIAVILALIGAIVLLKD